MDRMDKEKRRRLEKIKKNCNDPRRQAADNILLIGKSGAGKSSLLNTLYASIVDEYKPLTHTGKGEAQTVTLDLKWFKNCGVILDDVQGNDNEDILQEIVPKLPNIVDMPGLANEDTPELREMIRLIIQGFVPWGTNIAELLKKQKDQGVEKLSSVNISNDNNKINKVVFVQSCRDTVPTNLVNCLLGVLDETNPETVTQTYNGDRFVVVTMKDKSARFRKADNVEDILKGGSDMDSGSIVAETPEDTEKVLAKKFNIEGSLTHKLKWMSNYCDDNGYDNPDIATEALELLYHMTLPNAFHTSEETNASKMKGLKQGKKLDGKTSTSKMYKFFAFILWIIFIFFKLALGVGLLAVIVYVLLEMHLINRSHTRDRHEL